MPMLRRWCDAVGDRNPLRIDPVIAARSRLGGPVAPLSMLDVWTKPGLSYQRNPDDPQGATFARLDTAGFRSAMAVSSELVQDRHLLLGDTLRSMLMLDAVSSEKRTTLGPAHFVTTRQDFFAGDEPVGHARCTVMKFRPADGSRAAAMPPSDAQNGQNGLRADVGREEFGTLTAADLSPGQPIPPESIPVTATLIVAGALMTSDYFVGHHDRDAAVRLGSRDIFMNIHTSLGLIERCIGGWLSPNAVWRSMSTRLGVPSYPGDVLTVNGHVAAVGERGVTTLEYRVTNSLGVHAQGKVEVELAT